jgi:hypothetical protein
MSPEMRARSAAHLIEFAGAGFRACPCHAAYGAAQQLSAHAASLPRDHD